MSKLRKLLIVAALCGVGAASTGCVSVTTSGGVTTVAFWQRTSDTIDQWYHHDCHGDVPCTFFYIRANLCNHLGGAGKLVCYAGTDPNVRGAGGLSMASEFILTVAAREQQGGACLSIDNRGTVDWGRRNIGQDGCVH